MAAVEPPDSTVQVAVFATGPARTAALARGNDIDPAGETVAARFDDFSPRERR